MYAERTGDSQAREDAFRSMNYATYFARSDGRIACCGEDYHAPYWFSDGYADYLRHFIWTMGALPDLAPMGEDHILRSSSVIQKVSYRSGRVSYKTFDTEGIAVLRLTFKPTRIMAGALPLMERADLQQPGYTTEAAGRDYIVRIKHSGSSEIVVEGK
jgi:hypothetical protein